VKAVPEGTVAGPRVVGERKVGVEAGAAGADCKGIGRDAMPVTGLAESFSPMPRMAPPPLGSDGTGPAAGPRFWEFRPAKTTLAPASPMHANHQQEQFSRAYVRAVATVAGFSLYEPEVTTTASTSASRRAADAGAFVRPAWRPSSSARPRTCGTTARSGSPSS